jgi:nucleoside-diphosphate-sugar epimerase
MSFMLQDETAPPYRRVLITGAFGALGRKLVAFLSNSAWCPDIVAVDCRAPSQVLPANVQIVIADLADAKDDRWRHAFRGIDAVVHLAAQHASPGASWADAIASFDMTARVVEMAARSGVARFVFASSNHVMGGYKDPPLFKTVSPGRLSTDLAPSPNMEYGVSKLMGERLCCAKAELSGRKMTAVSVRIGWCQRGDNHPSTINASGVSFSVTGDAHDAMNSDLTWFRNMWLSDRDFGQLMQRALTADASGWNAAGIVVNAMSANTGMLWDIETTRQLIGYLPLDDVWNALKKTPEPQSEI